MGSMPKKLKNIPNFKSEDEEREFWGSHDSTEYIDWDRAKNTISPKLKPSTRKISLRLSESMLNELYCIANKMDIPYQSLIKTFLKDKIDEELKINSIKRLPNQSMTRMRR